MHRDVSPQNVLVGFDGAVKLIDFGVAKATGKIQQTAAGVIKGKLSYMSPEQALGAEIDHRSDVFSLGILFWETVTGTRLFKADNEPLTLQLVRECKVPRPSSVNPKLPPELDELVLSVLKKHPEERKYDAMTLRMAIEDFTISQRLPASSAHLVAFLQTLYADRMATERDPAWLDQLADEASPSGIRNEPGTPSGLAQLSLPRFAPSATPRPKSVSVKLGADADPRERTRAQPTTGESQALTQPTASHPSRSLAPLVAALVVVGLLVVGLIGWIAMQKLTGGPPEGVAVKASPPVAVEQAVGPSPTVSAIVPAVGTPDEAQVQLVSDPPGAKVAIDGVDMGTTPVTVAIRAASVRTAVFTLEKFEPKKVTVASTDGPSLTVQLKKKATKKGPPVPALEIRTDR